MKDNKYTLKNSKLTWWNNKLIEEIANLHDRSANVY